MANWTEVKNRITNFKNYVNGLSQAGKDAAKLSFVIPKSEMKKMLDQAGGASELDGLRVYLAADINAAGEMIPDIYVVAEKEEGTGVYNDYKIGTIAPVPTNQPLLAATYPCPTYCPGQNYINS